MNFRLSGWDPGLMTISGSVGSTFPRPRLAWTGPLPSTPVIPGAMAQGNSGPNQRIHSFVASSCLLPDVRVLCLEGQVPV